MRALKTSMSQRRQQSTDSNQIDLQTPSKQKLASFTQNNFFSPSSTFYNNKGFTATNYKSPGSLYGGSTMQNNTSTQDKIQCDTILLSSQQKMNAVHHLQGFSSGQKPGSGSSHKLNFLSSTNKNSYVDIKTKRVNDLNTIYSEGDNSEFNSQHVFMNKLVYQANSAAAVGIAQSQSNASIQNTKQNISTSIPGSENENKKNNIRIAQRKFVSQNSFNSLGLESRKSNRDHKNGSPTKNQEPQFEGLQNFVKTMYKNGSSGFFQSSSNFNPSNNSKTFYSATNSKRDYDTTQNNITGFLEDQDTNPVKPNTYKMKDLFITKINNSFITPKYIYFQNQPTSDKFQKRNSLLDKNALILQNSQSQQKLQENQNFVPPFLNGNQNQSLKAQYSSDSYQQFTKNENNTENKATSQSQLQLEFPENQSRDEHQQDAQLGNITAKQKTSKSQDLRKKYTLSIQSSMMTEIILPDNLLWNFEYLFIFINNLSQVKRKNNLKYTFLPIPQVQNMMSQTKLQNDFALLKEQLKTSLQINSKDLYLFLDDGTPINSHMDIVRSESKERRAIFVGGCGGFCGVNNLFIPDEMKFNLIKVINGLIEQSLLLQEKKFQKTDQQVKKESHIGQTRPNTESSQRLQSYHKLSQNINSQKDLEEVRSEEFLTKEQYLKKQNKEIVDRVVNILTHNPNAKIKRFEQGTESKRVKQLQKIEDLYDKQLSEFKKQALEVEASSSLGDNPEKQQTKNLRQIAEYVDEFLEQNFPQSNQPIKQALDQYSYSLVNNMQQKAPQKRNFIKENIQRFNSPQMAMKYIQNINRELFIKNIPKILQKYELSRHDLHSIYILYKALLTVSIQRIDWKEVAKGGIDFKTFEHGIDKISSQSEEIIRRMCNFENFINWNQFIDILYAVSGKTLESKIDIFIKVADTDRGGSLSKEEISELCYICLDKILPKEGEDDSMVQGLVEYFTRLLFTSLDVDPEDDIPLHKLKNAIVEGHPENDLLCFFCGVEYTK